jgi:hypothetical protein
MANSKRNNASRLAELEALKRATERSDQRKRRWKQVAFIAVSVIVLLSMILTLFVQP